VIRDYSLPSSALSYALVNPYEDDDLLLLRAKAELARKAAEAGTSDEGSISAPAAGPAAAGEGVTAGDVAGAPGGRLPKASFVERCGKALTKKRHFWKKEKKEE
jgi:hypothetical protein